MSAIATDLLGETVELVRQYFDYEGGTRGVVRAVYLSANPDREETGSPRSFVYCLLQLDAGELISVEVCYLRVAKDAGPGKAHRSRQH
jgi:hypothetical protein